MMLRQNTQAVSSCACGFGEKRRMKEERRELIEPKAHETRTCPSYALNYVAFNVLLSIQIGFSLFLFPGRVCHRIFIIEGLSGRLIPIHQTICTSFSSVSDRCSCWRFTECLGGFLVKVRSSATANESKLFPFHFVVVLIKRFFGVVRSFYGPLFNGNRETTT